MPVLPLRDTVLFPQAFMPLAVARESSVKLIDEAVASGQTIAVFAQREAGEDEPGQKDLHEIGTASQIHKMFKLPDGSLRIIVQGLARVRLDEITATRPYLRGKATEAPEILKDEDRLEIDALQRNIKANFQQIVSLSPLMSDDLQALASNITDPGRLADFIASGLGTIATETKQEVLQTLDVRARLDLLNRLLIKELEVLELGSKIQSQVQSEVGKNQRDYFLREQLKAIQKELGEGDDQTREIEELRTKLEAAGLPETVKKEALRELDRLSKMPPAAAEYTGGAHLSRLDRRAAVVEEDRRGHRPQEDQGHHGCRALGAREGQGPHSRIPRRAQAEPRHEGADPVLRRPSGRRQDLARRARSRSRSAASSCASRSAACATRRRFAAIAAPTSARCPARSSRGCAAPSRRTRCSCSTRSTSSAPTSAATRRRRCSRCSTRNRTTRSAITISTCRSTCRRCCSSRPRTCSTPIPPPLRDRMEVLELPGYTEEEKLAIARDHLVAKQVPNHGLNKQQVVFTDAGLRAVIRGYTREAGVRNLEREIGAICRKIARRRAEGDEDKVKVTPEFVEELLGSFRVHGRRSEGPHQAAGRGDRHGLDAGRRRRAVRRGDAHDRRRLAHAHRPARRRDEGIGRARRCRGCARTPPSGRSIRTSSRTPRCTCTCPRARSRRTVRRPA